MRLFFLFLFFAGVWVLTALFGWQAQVGAAHGFPRPSWSLTCLFWMILFPCVMVVHETGHFLAGIALGQRCNRFVVGPVEVARRRGRWTMKLIRLRLAAASVSLVPSSFDQFRWQRAVVAAGGPFVSLVSALAFGSLAFASHTAPLFWIWSMSALCSLACFSEIVPLRLRGFGTDGILLWEAIRGGEAFDRVQRDFLAVSSDATPLRVRDWPTDVIRRLAEAPADARNHRYSLYLAYVHFLDRGEIQLAGQYLNRLLEGWTAEDPPEFALEAAYFLAWHDRDMAAARHWLSLAPEDKLPGVRLRAEAAVAWLASGPEAARPLADKALALFRQPEACGSDRYEIDRLQALLAD